MSFRKTLIPHPDCEWTLLERGSPKSLCQCKCGRRKEVANTHLEQGLSKRCAKCARRMSRGMREDIAARVGDKHNFLTIIEMRGTDARNKRLALLQCICGKQIERRYDIVKRGTLKSCGCMKMLLQAKSQLAAGLKLHNIDPKEFLADLL